MTVALCLALALAAYALGRWHQHRLAARDRESLASYRKTHRRRSGWMAGYGNYEIESLDGGRNWFVVVRDEDGGVRVTGAAEKVFPGLVKTIDGFAALSDYAKRHGPLTLGGDRAVSDEAALKAAGFSVVRR